jgi:hypothetical protein
MNDIKILNPLEVPSWDEQILALPGCSFFHSAAWARVLTESYGYKPLYFSVLEGDRIRALLPLMEVNSFLTGRRGVSLPFTDFCEPLAEKEEDFREMWAAIQELGNRQGWRTMELRGGKDFLPQEPAAAAYYLHALALQDDPEKLFSRIKDTHQRNIKKARKAGVTVELRRDAQGLKAFCRLNAITRRDHGLPPQPSFFFETIGHSIISQGKGFVALADHQGIKVAAAVFFHFGGQAVYKYGASDKRFQNLRANNLVMWESLKWLAENNFQELHFGRTDLDHEGLRRFKTGWGTEEHRVQYRRYDFKTRTFRAAAKSGSGYSEQIFRRLPLFVLDRIGALLYRHVG